jgi:hypothetical protein
MAASVLQSKKYQSSTVAMQLCHKGAEAYNTAVYLMSNDIPLASKTCRQYDEACTIGVPLSVISSQRFKHAKTVFCHIP